MKLIAVNITIVIVISINIIKWPSGLPIPDSPFDHGGLVLLRARDLQLDLLDPFEGGAASTRRNMLTSPIGPRPKVLSKALKLDEEGLGCQSAPPPTD